VWGGGGGSPCVRTFQGLHSVRLWTPTIFNVEFLKWQLLKTLTVWNFKVDVLRDSHRLLVSLNREFEWQFGGKTVLAGLSPIKQLPVNNVEESRLSPWPPKKIHWEVLSKSWDILSKHLRSWNTTKSHASWRDWAKFRRIMSTSSRFGVRNLVGSSQYAYFSRFRPQMFYSYYTMHLTGKNGIKWDQLNPKLIIGINYSVRWHPGKVLRLLSE
jgi:hypothetical protein